MKTSSAKSLLQDPSTLPKNYWNAWIGLPHEIGADPREGRAACCLVIAQIVLQNAGYEVPPLDQMLQSARNRDWENLQSTFSELCAPVPEPRIPSITLVNNGMNGLGVVTVVAPNTLLSINHKRGVITLPLNRLRLLQFYVLKQ